MDKHIKIYKLHGKYCFTINKFSSIRHSHLTKFAENQYRYAWQAYVDAKKIAKEHFYHIDALEKFAVEDLQKPVIEDVSVEIKLSEHYEEILDGLIDTATGMDEDDKNQKKVNYFEAKSVVNEILFIIEKMPEDEIGDEEEKNKSKIKLESIISKIKSLVHKYYKEELKKDEENSKEKESEMPMGGMEDMPMEDPMGGMGDMGVMEDPMGGMPMASSNTLIKEAKSLVNYSDAMEELMDEYGKRACSAVENKHPGSIWIKKTNGIDLSDDGGSILFLDIGDDFFLQDVRPSDRIKKMYPYHSIEFYQAYWKPIVEKIGHCCVGNNTSILNLKNKCLPDIPKEFPYKSYNIETINKESKTSIPFVVSFKGEDKPSWFFDPSPISKTASAKYTKEEYYKNGKGAIVVCIDETLKSYYKKTGLVVQVIPIGEHLEVDINFGNHICRMTEDQFDILDDL